MMLAFSLFEEVTLASSSFTGGTSSNRDLLTVNDPHGGWEDHGSRNTNESIAK